jgi:hypothetical protein
MPNSVTDHSCCGIHSAGMRSDSLLNDISSPNRAAGVQKLIVVSIEFPDMKHYATIESIRELVFKELDGYYLEVSYRLMSISGDIVDA